MKWEAVLVMVLLLVLGAFLVYQPRPPLEPGQRLARVTIGAEKGWLIFSQPGSPTTPSKEAMGGTTVQFRHRDGNISAPIDAETFRKLVGDDLHNEILTTSDNPLFRLFNITNWWSLAWIVIGFGAQAVFAARFLVQWIVSEKAKQSVVPNIFWWISLVGGIMLYCYFVWRQDLPAVLGQSTGVVIYARNIRLIQKQRKRNARAQTAAPADLPQDPDPS